MTKKYVGNHLGGKRQSRDELFNKNEDLDKIYLNFYKNLYQYTKVSEDVFREILEGLPTIFMSAMNDSLVMEIIVKILSSTIFSMAKGKTHGHTQIPIEFFQQLWPTIGYNFHQMILKGLKNVSSHERVTKGLISLILNEGELRTSITRGQ